MKKEFTIRSKIRSLASQIRPADREEIEHITFVEKWIDSGAEIFRIAKPATPNPHLVAYFLLIDQDKQQLLLVDHKNANLWLPAGGHVEINEDPAETVKRECGEELRIKAEFLFDKPIFLTVTKTVGQTAGHTDVSLWYVLKGNSLHSTDYDKEEFNGVRWFGIDELPYNRSDPHMQRFIKKLKCELSTQ